MAGANPHHGPPHYSRCWIRPRCYVDNGLSDINVRNEKVGHFISHDTHTVQSQQHTDSRGGEQTQGPTEAKRSGRVLHNTYGSLPASEKEKQALRNIGFSLEITDDACYTPHPFLHNFGCASSFRARVSWSFHSQHRLDTM